MAGKNKWGSFNTGRDVHGFSPEDSRRLDHLREPERSSLHERATDQRQSPRSVCVLASGGLDSSVLVADATTTYDRVYPVFVRCGLRWEEVELAWLRRFLAALSSSRLEPLRVLEFPLTDLYGPHWSTTGESIPDREAALDAVYLPGRNILLLAKAAVYCSLNGIEEIAIGTLQANPFPDATSGFFARFADVLSEGLARTIHVRAPYRHLSKAGVIRRGMRWPLELTFSCISPRRGIHCGMCSKCAERHAAFVEAGLADPTVYDASFSAT